VIPSAADIYGRSGWISAFKLIIVVVEYIDIGTNVGYFI
jgi:hypothetical protein